MLPDEKITLRSRLGFIGLGYLGSRIARRLVDAGFPMVVYDLDNLNAMELAHAGAGVARHPEELAREVDVVLSCLPDELAVEAVYLKAGNVLRNARNGTRIIELSTISPEASLQLHRAAQKLDISVLDLAVSGSTPIAEAVALGVTLDLPRDLLLDTLAKTAVVAPAHTGKLASAKKNDYAPQFKVRLMHKDFGLVLAAAARSGLAMPATEAAAAINTAEAASGGEEDFSAVIRRMEQEAVAASLLRPVA